MLTVTIRCFSLSCLFCLPFVLAIATMPMAQAQVTNPSTPNNEGKVKSPAPTPANAEESQPEDLTDPNNLRPLTQADSLLSLAGGQRLMTEASEAINTGKYDEAINKLQQARKIFNQLSNFHLQLANSFSGIDTQIFESQRSSALKTGQMRDEVTYQLALVHRAQNQSELAVPLLIQVIRSQNPTSELGKKSYQQLYELGFVSAPYSAQPVSNPTPTPNPSPNPNPSK
jgi:tetratricopeptide (TPR) repeat protein